MESKVRAVIELNVRYMDSCDWLECKKEVENGHCTLSIGHCGHSRAFDLRACLSATQRSSILCGCQQGNTHWPSPGVGVGSSGNASFSHPASQLALRSPQYTFTTVPFPTMVGRDVFLICLCQRVGPWGPALCFAWKGVLILVVGKVLQMNFFGAPVLWDSLPE